MNISIKNIAEAINYLSNIACDFALFRLPNTSEIILFVDKQLGNENGFVIQAFDTNISKVSIANDIVLKNEDITVENLKQFNLKSRKKELNEENEVRFMNQSTFENYVQDIIENCSKGKITKGVAARVKVVKKPKYFDLGNYFSHLLQNYTTAFVHIFYEKDKGLWLGATPETLISKANNVYKTVSLAGTKLIAKNRTWTSKEKEEQQIVTDYIVNMLKKNNCTIENNLTPKTIEAGLIAHIKTEIQFLSTKSFLDIAKILHPTPAVCGMPKFGALKIIQKHEGDQRRLYSGFIGVNSPDTKATFVNLRCMQVLENKLMIYVGAGITKDSIPNKEWQETENKAQTLMRFL